MEPPKRSGESAAHLALKRLAVTWACGHRLPLCATEVRLPRCNYRADVAAATPGISAPNAAIAIFECKASRADFLRDSANESAVRNELVELAERLRSLREMIGQHRPDLRRGEELFPEFDAIDLRGVQHETHDRLAARLRVIQAKLLEGTKFSKLRRWSCATLMYLVCEENVAAPFEVPDGWGLLVREGDSLQLRLRPCLHETSLGHRVAFLERIASATTRGELRGLGVLEAVHENSPWGANAAQQTREVQRS
ncbi:MAG TPA: hypothetical protein VFT72_16850 [Opitutaceae bacterium]|nr:hypothetical protein [Opitutaceae bacterium]